MILKLVHTKLCRYFYDTPPYKILRAYFYWFLSHSQEMERKIHISLDNHITVLHSTKSQWYLHVLRSFNIKFNGLIQRLRGGIQTAGRTEVLSADCETGWQLSRGNSLEAFCRYLRATSAAALAARTHSFGHTSASLADVSACAAVAGGRAKLPLHVSSC
jgi:hypothetical protein